MKLITSKIIFLLATILLSDSALFASKDRPIYTIKNYEVHRSSGPNQDQCTRSCWKGTTRDGKIVASVSKCQENKTEKRHWYLREFTFSMIQLITNITSENH